MLSGRTCREDIDECVSQPCFPGVGCNNTVGSFFCGSCPQGYSGDGKNCMSKSTFYLYSYVWFCLREHLYILFVLKESLWLKRWWHQWGYHRFRWGPSRRVCRHAPEGRATQECSVSRASMFQQASSVDPALLVCKEMARNVHQQVRVEQFMHLWLCAPCKRMK